MCNSPTATASFQQHQECNMMDKICEANNHACKLLREENHELALRCLVSVMADTNGNSLATMASNEAHGMAANIAALRSTEPVAYTLSVDFMTSSDGGHSQATSTPSSPNAWHSPLFLTKVPLPISHASVETKAMSQARHRSMDQMLSFVLIYNISLALQHIALHQTIRNNLSIRLPMAEKSINMYHHAQILLLAMLTNDGASTSASTMFAMSKAGICATLILNVGEVNRRMGHAEQANLCFQHAVHLLISARNAQMNNPLTCTKEEAMHQFCENILDDIMRQSSAPAA